MGVDPATRQRPADVQEHPRRRSRRRLPLGELERRLDLTVREQRPRLSFAPLTGARVGRSGGGVGVGGRKCNSRPPPRHSSLEPIPPTHDFNSAGLPNGTPSVNRFPDEAG